jgi:hypothetical protein
MARPRKAREKVVKAVAKDDFREIISWLRENTRVLENAIDLGNRGLPALLDNLDNLVALADKAGHADLGAIRPPKKDLSYTYALANKANLLLSYWAREQGRVECPRAVKARDKIRIIWDHVPEDSVRRPRRVWVILSRWWDECIDEFLRGMSAMVEQLGIGLCVRPVDRPDDIPGEIEGIVDHHTMIEETASIVVLLGNTSELKQTEEVRRAIRTAKEQNEGNLFLTTVGREYADLHLDNEKIGEFLAERMLEDLAKAGRLDGEGTIAIFGTTEKDSTDPFKARRRSFRNTVTQQAKEVGKPGFGHRLEMPDMLNVDPGLMFDPMASWKVRDQLKKFLSRPEGHKVRAVYTQTLLFTLGAALAIQDVGRADLGREDGIFLYAEYISPSLLRWLRDEKWPLAAICGVDPYHYGRLALRAAYLRSREQPNQIEIPPILISREMVSGPRRLTYMIDLPRLFPDRDIRLEEIHIASRKSLAKEDNLYKKLLDRAQDSLDSSEP